EPTGGEIPIRSVKRSIRSPIKARAAVPSHRCPQIHEQQGLSSACSPVRASRRWVRFVHTLPRLEGHSFLAPPPAFGRLQNATISVIAAATRRDFFMRVSYWRNITGPQAVPLGLHAVSISHF